MANILGLDLGTNSIGWALIDNINNKILGAGARIFPEGVEKLGDGENEISKNASRTANRGKRRQIFRKQLRKRLLLKLMSQHNMCPLTNDNFVIWNRDRKFPDTAELRAWFALNPYELRAKALVERISMEELGRIFYHMIQRRGFQSNSRSGGTDEGVLFEGKAADGKIGINETAEKIADSTLGEYLNQIRPKDFNPFEAELPRIRNRYTTRSMYVDEFEKIWESQSKYHEELTIGLKTKIGGRKKEEEYNQDGILFFQRELRSQKHTVGNCTFEPKKHRCPISAVPFEKFRAYQWANTVECNGQKLTEEERNVVVSLLFAKEKPAFKDIRKALKKLDSQFNFNYKDDDKIVGSYTISNLSNKKYFGADWNAFSDAEQDEIWQIIYFFEDRAKLKAYALRNWNFSETQAEAISKFNLKDGYSSLSRKAINNILPYLQNGYIYDIAVVLGGIQNAFGTKWAGLTEEEKSFIEDNIPSVVRQQKKGGFIDDVKQILTSEFGLNEEDFKKLYHHSASIQAGEIAMKLPLGKDADKEIQNLKNPIVVTALFELRKLVNELIDLHGSLDQINVEMARDLKISKTKRNEIRREQKRLERENDRIKIELDLLGQRPTHDNILKYKLWEECDRTCPYTGKQIGTTALFNGEVQIEHIIPWSRSLNDSFMNKTLCYADENRNKGDKTPYELYVVKSK